MSAAAASRTPQRLACCCPRLDTFNPCHVIAACRAGLLALIYFSRVAAPDRRPADADAGAELAYSNAKTGIWAMVLVFLGACQGRWWGSSSMRLR